MSIKTTTHNIDTHRDTGIYTQTQHFLKKDCIQQLAYRIWTLSKHYVLYSLCPKCPQKPICWTFDSLARSTACTMERCWNIQKVSQNRGECPWRSCWNSTSILCFLALPSHKASSLILSHEIMMCCRTHWLEATEPTVHRQKPATVPTVHRRKPATQPTVLRQKPPVSGLQIKLLSSYLTSGLIETWPTHLLIYYYQGHADCWRMLTWKLIS